MASICNDLLALLWPCACIVCGAPDREVCDTCVSRLRARAGRSHTVLAPNGIEVRVFGAYDGAVKELLVACKHRSLVRFAPLLGELLSGPLQEAVRLRRGRSPVLIVTAPSRVQKVRARGFRHVDLMVRAALRRRGGPVARDDPQPILIPGALKALAGRTGQVGLRAGERTRNANLVRVPRHMRGRLRGREIVLVDDIVTTGATLEAAAGALAAAGAQVIAAVVLCSVERRDLPQGSATQTHTAPAQRRLLVE